MARSTPDPDDATETVDDLLHRTDKSLEAVAAGAGVTRRTLFAARSGGPVSRATLVKLAKFLRVPAARFKRAMANSAADK